MFRSTLPVLCSTLALASACSIVNAPADPTPPTTSAGGAGGSGGVGAAGGQGGSGGAVCGNGVVEGAEACDDGMETATCNVDCTAAACADGVVNKAAGEQCDDGNTATGDACDSDCKATPFVIDANVAAAGFSGQIHHIPGVGVTPVSGEEQFVVAWSRGDLSTPATTVVRALVDHDGAISDNQLQVSTSPSSLRLSLATNSEGKTLLAWRTNTMPPTLKYRFLAAGGALIGVGDFTMPGATPQISPTVASGADDGFCVLWSADSDSVAHSRCFNAAGDLVGALSTLETITPGQITPHMLFAVKGGYIAGYRATDAMKEARGQVLDNQGAPVGGPFLLWGVNGSTQFGNGVGNVANAKFLLTAAVRSTFNETNSVSRVFVEPFSSPGNAVSAEVLLGDQHVEELTPWLTRSPQGGDVIATWSRVTASSTCELLVQRIDGSGAPLGMPLTEYAPGADQCPVYSRGAVNSAGDVMVVFDKWSDVGPAQIQALIYRRLLE